MDIALLVARLLLFLVFVVAGVAKLADRAGSRQAVVDFGVPASLAAPLGILLPLAELGVAAALIPTTTAWGALGALALLLLFVAGIGINLARGRQPDCHCFGQIHSAPASWSTLARNGVYAVVAGFILWGGRGGAGPSLFGWSGSLTAAQVVGFALGLILLAVLAAQWWVLIHLLRQNGRLLVRLEALESGLASGEVALSQNGSQPAGLPINSPVPTFDLVDLYGETHSLGSLHAPGKQVMLLFIAPDCEPCTNLLPEVGCWQRDYSDEVTIALISRGDPEENRAKSEEHGVEHVLLQRDWEVSEAYRSDGTPSAVLIGPDGTIGSPLARGSEEVEVLMAQAVGASGPTVPIGKKVGEPAPPFELPDLDGRTIDLSGFRGSETLILFWNPDCAFCNQMLDDLKALETNPPTEAPKLLIVSNGTVEANKAMGLSSPMVLDQEYSVDKAFGAPGTPSAVLVDAEGKIASEVAVGPTEVLELAGADTAAR